MTDEDEMSRMGRIQAEGMRAMSEKEMAAQNMMNSYCRNIMENVTAEKKPLTRWDRFVRWIKH